jgi:hypothetical protein
VNEGGASLVERREAVLAHGALGREEQDWHEHGARLDGRHEHLQQGTSDVRSGVGKRTSVELHSNRVQQLLRTRKNSMDAIFPTLRCAKGCASGSEKGVTGRPALSQPRKPPCMKVTFL